MPISTPMRAIRVRGTQPARGAMDFVPEGSTEVFGATGRVACLCGEPIPPRHFETRHGAPDEEVTQALAEQTGGRRSGVKVDRLIADLKTRFQVSCDA
jgi:hypothetical protein